MCVYEVTEWKTARRPFYVYKQVKPTSNPSKFRSPYTPDMRSHQHPLDDMPYRYAQGTSVIYILNQEVTSLIPETPGFYTYSKKPYNDWFSSAVIIKCLIKQGTRYRKEIEDYGRIYTILVEALTPIEVIN